MSERKGDKRRKKDRKSSSSDSDSERDHTIIEIIPTVVPSGDEETLSSLGTTTEQESGGSNTLVSNEEGRSNTLVSEENTLVSGGQDGGSNTLVSGNSNTLVSENSIQSDSGVIVFVRGTFLMNGEQEAKYANLRKAFSGSVRYLDSSDADFVEIARRENKHLLVVNEGYYTDCSARILRTRILDLLVELEHCNDIRVVLLHRSGDQCQKLRNSSVRNVLMGTDPKECGAYLIHSNSYAHVDSSRIISSSNNLGCYSYSIFTHVDRTVNESAICTPSNVEYNSASSMWAWAIGGGVLLIIIIIIILLIFRRKGNAASV